jgi:hypothetical protein
MEQQSLVFSSFHFLIRIMLGIHTESIEIADFAFLTRARKE